LRAYRSRARTDGTIVVCRRQDARPSADAEPQFVRTVLDAIYATAAGKAVRPGWWSRWRATRTSRIKQLQLPGGAGPNSNTSRRPGSTTPTSRSRASRGRVALDRDDRRAAQRGRRARRIDVSGGRARGVPGVVPRAPQSLRRQAPLRGLRVDRPRQRGPAPALHRHDQRSVSVDDRRVLRRRRRRVLGSAG
jgi:hypothetical protein